MSENEIQKSDNNVIDYFDVDINNDENHIKKEKDLRIINKTNSPEDPDNDREYQEQEKQHRLRLNELKHKVIYNIYYFMYYITKLKRFRTIVIISLLIIYPLSKLNLSNINEKYLNFLLLNFDTKFIENVFFILEILKQYSISLIEVLKPLGTFILGFIVNDWASSKLKK